MKYYIVLNRVQQEIVASQNRYGCDIKYNALLHNYSYLKIDMTT